MTVRPVLELGDPRLREPAQAVPPDAFGSEALDQLVRDLIDTMRARNGAGIAAPQIGVSQRVFVVEVGDNPRYPYKPKIPLTVLVNPALRIVGDDQISVIEGCLSVPNLRGRVRRAAVVELSAFTPKGAKLTLRAEGLSAGTMQHEFDHLDGRLFIDHVMDRTSLSTWENYERHQAQAFQAEAEAINLRYPQPLSITSTP